jgi:hypothetical protein
MGYRAATTQMTETETVVAIDQYALMVAPLGHAAPPLLSTGSTITLAHRLCEIPLLKRADLKKTWSERVWRETR